jgi:chaperonin GroES
MDWKPLYDKILVRRNKAPETIGVVIVPEQAKTPQSVGEVVATGEGRLNTKDGVVYPLKLYPGCHVMFGPYSGVEVPELGEDLVLLREDEIHAFAEPEA